MTSQTQPTFAGGEVSPAVAARVDLELYSNSLAKCRNFIVRKTGGIDNRPGTEYVGEIGDSSQTARLIPFEFNTSQTYVLVLGDYTMRVVMDGGFVEDSDDNMVEFATPWGVDDLARLNYTQSADVMWIVHPDYAPRKITRSSHASWTIAEYSFDPPPFQDVNADEDVTAYASAASGEVTVTANSEIFASTDVGAWFYLDFPELGNTLTWASDTTFSVGNYCYSDQKFYYCTNRYTANTDFTSWKAGGTQPTWDEGQGWDGQGYYDSGSSNSSYNIGFKWEYINYGYGMGQIVAVASDGMSATVAITTQLSVRNVGSSNTSYKWAISAFGETTGYPTAIGFYQQRLCLAATASQPQTVWLSESNIYNSHLQRRPSEDSDGIAFTLGSQQVNEIRHIVQLRALLLLTSGGVWTVSGDSNGIITPSTQNASKQNSIGCSYVRPQVIGSDLLFIDDKGCVVYQVAYQYSSDSYDPTDLSVKADHLFKGFEITGWAFARVPYSAVFAVRDDGKLLCLTYLKEQQISGWSLLETDGNVESVAVISEDNIDAVYLLVKRTVNGATKRYVERMHSRQFDTLADAFFVDCGLTYDGRNTGDTTVTISGDDYAFGNELTATFSASTLSSSDVGKVIHAQDPDDNDRILRFEITGYTSATVATVMPQRDVPESLQGVATSDWGLGVYSVSGLDHLEGCTVSILAEGAVLDQQTVSGGAITSDTSATVLHVGLPYTATMQTLDMYMQLQGASTVGKRKVISSVAVLCDSSSGIKVGQSADNLRPAKQRDYEFYDQNEKTVGFVDVNIDGTWNRHGNFMIVQDDPLPLSILSVTPEVTIGG